MALLLSSSPGIKPSRLDCCIDPLSDFIPRRSANSDGLSDYTSHDKGELLEGDYSNDCLSDRGEIVDQARNLGAVQGSLIPCSFSASSQKFSGPRYVNQVGEVVAAASPLLSESSNIVSLKSGFRQLSDSGSTCSHESKSIVTVVSWDDVPSDLLYLLAKSPKLDVSDLVRFGTVCLSWRSILNENCWFGYGPQLEALSLSAPHFPKLMVAHTDTSDGSRDFFDVTTDRTFQLPLAEAQERRVCGLNDGWVITIGEDMEIHLLNLITRQRIELPSQLSFDDFGLGMTNEVTHSLFISRQGLLTFINKAILIGSPLCSSSCTVAAIVYPGKGSSRVALVRPGLDKSWTVLIPGYDLISDIIHHKGLLYAISFGYAPVLYVWDMNNINRGSPQEMTVSPLSLPFPHPLIHNETFYLVEISGELVGVGRIRGWNRDWTLRKDFCTCDVVVFKLNSGVGVEVNDLGDCCLFVGCNSSKALSPVPSGFRKNCIYFTDDYLISHGEEYRSPDLGVYSLDDGKYSQFDHGNLVKSFSRSIWVTFNPRKIMINI